MSTMLCEAHESGGREGDRFRIALTCDERGAGMARGMLLALVEKR